MAQSPAERHREVTNTLSTLTERIDNVRNQIRDLHSFRDRSADDLNGLRRELDMLKQRLDDHLKRMEVWSGRLWALVVVLIGAVLSLASGLIVTLARK
jgi:chromosome segregation ATPase